MLRESAVQNLRSAVRGAVLAAGDPDYDAARRVFNAMIDRRPELIARGAGAADVVACVRFAREHDVRSPSAAAAIAFPESPCATAGC